MKTKRVYDLFVDEKEFDKFLNIIPNCDDTEMYYMELHARKKYNNLIPNDKCQLKRDTSTKDRLRQKIKQLEVPYGCYSYGEDSLPIPEDSLIVYLSITPRSLKKANDSLLKELASRIVGESYKNPKSLAMSVIQESKSKASLVDFYYDCKNDGYIDHLYRSLENSINGDAINIIETRGGYHVLVKPHKVSEKYKNTWYNNMKKIDGFDKAGDNLIPIPGTRQGGFIVKLLK